MTILLFGCLEYDIIIKRFDIVEVVLIERTTGRFSSFEFVLVTALRHIPDF